MGDLYLVAPLGLLLGWPAIFLAIFLAALISSLTSIALLVSRRVGLKSYIPFGPFLVAGAVLTLLRDEKLLGGAGDAAATVRRMAGHHPNVRAPVAREFPFRYWRRGCPIGYPSRRAPCSGA